MAGGRRRRYTVDHPEIMKAAGIGVAVAGCCSAGRLTRLEQEVLLFGFVSFKSSSRVGALSLSI